MRERRHCKQCQTCTPLCQRGYCRKCCHGCDIHLRRCKNCKTMGECSRCGCSAKFDDFDERVCFCDACHNKSCRFTEICLDGYCSKCCHGCEKHVKCTKCRSGLNICVKGYCGRCCFGCDTHEEKCRQCHKDTKICEKKYCATCCHGCKVHLVCLVCKRRRTKEELCSHGRSFDELKGGACHKCCRYCGCVVHGKILTIYKDKEDQWTFYDLSGTAVLILPAEKIILRDRFILFRDGTSSLPPEVYRATLCDEYGKKYFCSHAHKHHA